MDDNDSHDRGAVATISDPQRRARYDVQGVVGDRNRSSLVAKAVRTSAAIETDQLLRFDLLELLHDRRRTEPRRPGIYVADLETLLGRPGEHIEFALWYLLQRQYVAHTDGSQLVITADGVDYLEGLAYKHTR